MGIEEVQRYDSQNRDFRSALYAEIRSAAYEEDIGQNGWQTAAEQNLFIEWMRLEDSSHLLDVACGSAGPAIRIAERTGCSISGVDIHVGAIRAESESAVRRGLKASF